MYIIQKAVDEKQSKTRESMRMMGMIESAYWFSWFVAFVILILIVSTIMTIGSIPTMFQGSNYLIIFMLFFFYGLSLFGFAILVITVFDSVKTATAGGMIINLLTYYLRYLFSGTTPVGIRILSSIIPSLNIYSVNKSIWANQAYESISFGTMGDLHDNYNFIYFFIMCLVNLIVWTIFSLYILAILPTEFGTRKHPCFCLRRKRRIIKDQDNTYAFLEESGDEDSEDMNKTGAFERVGNDLKELESENECLKIKKLSKIFSNGFQAVKDLSLTMYSGQIFALLGHNGAGKTTTISMLTGLFGNSGGHAEAFGIDILNNQEEARKIMGVCPQHNVLFPILTPEEHFDIFCDFKGIPNNQRRAAIDKCILDVDLKDKRHAIAKTLSGGQQRKVSVGIALLGDSKIVLLDEPTSGMDPTARRRLWDLLKENKEDRIIILTTHFMEEADILGDRIAIMANGEAQCCGSSLFLKRKFGVGYNLTVDKTTQRQVPELEKFVMDRIPNAIKLSEVSSEATFQLPNSEIDKFKEFFI